MELRLVQTTIIVATAWSILAGVARAGAIAVWNPSPYAPQVVMQDDATGAIFHSVCNNNGTTIFPNDASLVLGVDQRLAPRRNSRLSGVGWWAEDGEWAAIQYQTKDNAIVHSLWICDGRGHFQSKGSWIVSYIAPPVKPNSGLASVILGSTAGYRIYYQDSDNSTCALSYSEVQGMWKYDGIISHDAAQGSAISAAWTTPEDIHIARSRTSQEIEVTKLRNNVTWDIATFPTPLKNVTVLSNNSSTEGAPSDNTTSTQFALDTSSAADWSLEAWDGKATSIAYTIDSQNKSSIFYIGTDAQIHQVEEVGGKWQMAPRQKASVWPAADNKTTELGATHSVKTGEVWLFYMSKGAMVSGYRSNDSEWRDAQIVRTSDPNASDPGTDGGGSLTTQAKIGVGVGIGLSVTALCGLVVFVVMLKRRKAKADEKQWKEASRSSLSAQGSKRSASSARSSDWPEFPKESCWVPEAQSVPIHELENQVWSHELSAPHAQLHELAVSVSHTDTGPRP